MGSPPETAFVEIKKTDKGFTVIQTPETGYPVSRELFFATVEEMWAWISQQDELQ